MSGTITAAPPDAAAGPAGGAGASAPATGAGRRAALRRAVRDFFSGTPGHLRLAAVAVIAGALVAALGGAAAARFRADALADARTAAARLVVIDEIRTSLLEADAAATNAFLAGGVEPAAQREVYSRELAEASRALAAAARTAPAADAREIGAVTESLAAYAGSVETARANNRQGFPIGATYLNQASRILRGEGETADRAVIPRLTRLAEADAAAIDAAYGRSGLATVLLLAALLLGLGALIVAQVWLARRTRRVFNVPAAAATAALVVLLLGTGGLMVLAQGRAQDVRDGPLAEASALSEARVAGFQARSIESLGLVVRGTGRTREPDWQAAGEQAAGALAGIGSTGARPFADYRARHDEIRERDDVGDWAGAVGLATGDGASAFGEFATATGDELRAAAPAVDDGLAGAARGLGAASWVLVVAGLLAAAVGWWGVSLRLDEYR